MICWKIIDHIKQLRCILKFVTALECPQVGKGKLPPYPTHVCEGGGLPRSNVLCI